MQKTYAIFLKCALKYTCHCTSTSTTKVRKSTIQINFLKGALLSVDKPPHNKMCEKIPP
jgi:hypothetical protein